MRTESHAPLALATARLPLVDHDLDAEAERVRTNPHSGFADKLIGPMHANDLASIGAKIGEREWTTIRHHSSLHHLRVADTMIQGEVRPWDWTT